MNTSSLLLIIGLPGTGKTTFAKVLAKKLKAYHLNSDVIRQQIGKKGQYDSASKALVYEALLKRTEQLLQKNKSVILDATLFKNSLRKPYLALAKRYNIPARWIELKADEKVIMQRVYQERPFSEADFAVYQKIKALYEPLELEHLSLWSDRSNLDNMIKKTEEYLTFTNVYDAV